MKKICLSCKHYKVKNIDTGICRVLVKKTNNKDADKPQVPGDSTCKEWSDSGQQYFIRKGWIKGQKKKNSVVN